jgi:hypothetical protein
MDFVVLLADVLDDHRHPAIAAVGIAADFRYLLGTQSGCKHNAPRSVGAVAGEFPVAIGFQGLRIRMPLDRDCARTLIWMLSSFYTYCLVSGAAPGKFKWNRVEAPYDSEIFQAHCIGGLRRPHTPLARESADSGRGWKPE